MGFEGLDIERGGDLVGYLRATGRIDASEEPVIRVLEGGVSNRTVLVERPAGDGRGESWVVKQALEKLRVQVDWFSDPQRIHREAMGLRWLTGLAPAGTITPLVFEDERHLIAMVAVPEPHENWKESLLAGRLDLDHVEQFAELLATIQRNAYARRGELREVFEERSYFTSLRLEPYYGYSAEQIPEAEGFLRGLVDETLSRRDTLVHGDYSPKNVLVREGRLILLDHEVIHFGDPAFDLGFSMTHLLSKAHHMKSLREDFAEATRFYWTTYRDHLSAPPWAEDIEERAVRHTLGCLLARVAGRSPLEYLSEAERERQREVVVAMMAKPPGSVDALVGEFVERIGA